MLKPLKRDIRNLYKLIQAEIAGSEREESHAQRRHAGDAEHGKDFEKADQRIKNYRQNGDQMR